MTALDVIRHLLTERQASTVQLVGLTGYSQSAVELAVRTLRQEGSAVLANLIDGRVTNGPKRRPPPRPVPEGMCGASLLEMAWRGRVEVMEA